MVTSADLTFRAWTYHWAGTWLRNQVEHKSAQKRGQHLSDLRRSVSVRLAVSPRDTDPSARVVALPARLVEPLRSHLAAVSSLISEPHIWPYGDGLDSRVS